MRRRDQFTFVHRALLGCALALPSCALSDNYYIDASAGAGGDDTSQGGKGATSGAGTAGGGVGSESVELSRRKPAAASSEQLSGDHVASMGNDGDEETRWTAFDGTAPQAWWVDLGSVLEITRVEIDWEFPRAYGYLIEISSDGFRYHTAVDRGANRNTSQRQTAELAASARFVRITITSLSSFPVSWASFWEVRVFGLPN